MGDYLPKFKPGDSITRTASAVITGGQVVVVSGSGTVAPAAAADTKWLGVAGHDTAIGEPVTIFKGGIQRPLVAAAVTAGDQVVTAANGRVTPLAAAAGATAGDINSARQVVGIALTTQTTVGQPVEVDFNR